MSRKATTKNNVEFVSELMDFSSTGPLMQVFVLQAIEKYAHDVMSAPTVKRGKNDPIPMISETAWKKCAEEIVTSLEARYAPDQLS